jgi:mRNA interferase RelE/StbE
VTEYLVTIAASANKELKDLPPDTVERVLLKIRELTGNPRPVGCRKLHGYKDRWRIRVGNYRVIYRISDAGKSVDITRIAHRKDVYEQ